MWYFYSKLPGCSSVLRKAKGYSAPGWFDIDLNVVSCILQHSPIVFPVFTAVWGEICMEAVWRNWKPGGSGGKEGIAQLRYQPGAEWSSPQVLKSGLLSGIPRSHPEGASWVGTGSSRALTTAKSWWRMRGCSSVTRARGESATAFAPCGTDNATPALATICLTSSVPRADWENQYLENKWMN